MTDPSNDDSLLGKLMKAAGPRPALPPDREQAWATHFRTEFSAVLGKRRQRMRLWAIAAVVSAMGVGVLLQQYWPAAHTTPVAQVVLLTGDTATSNNTPLAPGGQVHAGDRLRTGSMGHVALDFGGEQLRLDKETIVDIRTDYVVLERGSVYLDVGSDASTGVQRVETAFGTVTHIGTQFQVIIDDRALTVAVREGTVSVQSASATQQLSSAADMATMASVTHKGISLSRMPRHGGIWSWVYEAAPRFAIDGHSAHEFLLWASRESGCPLEYIDNATRIQAERAILSGDMSDLLLDDALQVLTATTNLEANTRSDGEIRDRCVIAVKARGS